MNGSEGQRPTSLRERKKAKTRDQIQAHALRLFSEHGYYETSIEQIAEAAEVSPSTVFRYFPTKPDLVTYDAMDQGLADVFRTQPPDLSTLQALRAAMKAVFQGDEALIQRDRGHLIMSIPELRKSMLDEFLRSLEGLAGLIAERLGRPVDDEIVALSGAVMGLGLAAWQSSDGELTQQYLEKIDNGIRLLESGFRL